MVICLGLGYDAVLQIIKTTASTLDYEMPRKFCYFGCKLDVPMHRFPKPNYINEVRFNMWLAVLSEETKLKGTSYILGNVYICDRHFEQKFRTAGKRLTANSYPSLNLSQQYRDLDSDNSESASVAEGMLSTVSSVMNIQTEISHATKETLPKASSSKGEYHISEKSKPQHQRAYAPNVSQPSPLSTAECYKKLIRSCLSNEPVSKASALKVSSPTTPVSTAEHYKIFIRNTLDNEPHCNASTPQTDPLDVRLKEDVSVNIDSEDTEIATFLRIGIQERKEMEEKMDKEGLKSRKDVYSERIKSFYMVFKYS
ncbi:unnamed protein product [Parnassius apollo]|uniref:(apollo) hypothetical protein n=1 Tax=Parnassius apollo TaxID=110799 RepID=A0A8S3XF09_PARAO|nr:unnamed protein product [Parnassius apollo]